MFITLRINILKYYMPDFFLSSKIRKLSCSFQMNFILKNIFCWKAQNVRLFDIQQRRCKQSKRLRQHMSRHLVLLLYLELMSDTLALYNINRFTSVHFFYSFAQLKMTKRPNISTNLQHLFFNRCSFTIPTSGTSSNFGF